MTSPASVCSLIGDYSSDPYVSAGLCDKLEAWQNAMDRDNTVAADRIMVAFENLLSAQTDKALTASEVEMILDLVSYL